jgi:uroporphyrinogen decarboxylase
VYISIYPEVLYKGGYDRLDKRLRYDKNNRIYQHEWYIVRRGLMQYSIISPMTGCPSCTSDFGPTWLDNGVNTMFPLEYGAWEYDFETMRKKFGKELRGIGNIDKKAFSKDRKAVDHEVERAKRLVDLGGFVSCPDHWIPIDSEWDLVRYYCGNASSCKVRVFAV